MSEPKRFFRNNLPVGESSVVSGNLLKCSVIEKYEAVVQKQDEGDSEGGLYVGLSGVAYLCFHLSRSPLFLDSREALLTKARDLLRADLDALRHKKTSSKDDTAFLLGHAGLYALAAAVFNGEHKIHLKHVKKDFCSFIVKNWGNTDDFNFTKPGVV